MHIAFHKALQPNAVSSNVYELRSYLAKLTCTVHPFKLQIPFKTAQVFIVLKVYCISFRLEASLQTYKAFKPHKGFQSSNWLSNYLKHSGNALSSQHTDTLKLFEMTTDVFIFCWCHFNKAKKKKTHQDCTLTLFYHGQGRLLITLTHL